MNHGDMNPGLSSLRQSFILLAQPPTPTQPAQGPFHHPSAWQHLKVVTIRRTPDNLLYQFGIRFLIG